MGLSGSVPLPLHWELHGDSGPPLLLLHGFGANGFTWNRWLPDLSRDHRVYVVEMKGFGDAPKPRDEAYSPLDQALLVHRLILQQELEDLIILGHSMGGGVAALVALRLMDGEPSRLSRLILLAGAALPQPLSPFIRMAERRYLGPLLLRIFPPRFVIRKALQLAYHDPTKVTGSQVEAYAQPLERPEGRYALSRTARQFLTPETLQASAELGRITVPTLLLWGDHDRIVPLWVGRKLEKILPRARLEILEDCGHMPQEEIPEEALERVRGFLAEESREPDPGAGMPEPRG